MWQGFSTIVQSVNWKRPVSILLHLSSVAHKYHWQRRPFSRLVPILFLRDLPPAQSCSRSLSGRARSLCQPCKRSTWQLSESHGGSSFMTIGVYWSGHWDLQNCAKLQNQSTLQLGAFRKEIAKSCLCFGFSNPLVARERCTSKRTNIPEYELGLLSRSLIATSSMLEVTNFWLG
jgi:hypothetical protein